MIRYEVLGPPGGDNALLVTVDTGQAMHRLLFDCGEGCLSNTPAAHVQTLYGVFFSHFHVDHIAGFDAFLRLNFYREANFAQLYGPPGAADVLQHRLQGYTWNLVQGSPGEIHVHEIGGAAVTSYAMKTGEGFATRHALGERPFDSVVLDTADYTVQACPLPHGIASMSYRVNEKPSRNMNLKAVQQLGLRPGAWMQSVKNPGISDNQQVEIEGATHNVGSLREQLLTITPGDSIAYLTDFRLDDQSRPRLLEMIAGCRVLVCENQYCNADEELAARNFHMVSADAGRLAADAGAEQLVVFHVSPRYTPAGWAAQLAEVAAVFPAAAYPPHWQIE